MKKNLFRLLLLTALMALFAACNNQVEVQQSTKVAPTTNTPTVKVEASIGNSENNEQVAGVLAKADALDGTEDKVVGKCAGCALAMDGSHDHQLSVGDYKMNFCSQYCADEFGKETETKILALNMPETVE